MSLNPDLASIADHAAEEITRHLTEDRSNGTDELDGAIDRYAECFEKLVCSRREQMLQVTRAAKWLDDPHYPEDELITLVYGWMKLPKGDDVTWLAEEISLAVETRVQSQIDSVVREVFREN